MRKIAVLACVLSLLMTGCVSNKVRAPEFPPNIAPMCQQQLDNAKKGIESISGKPLKYKSSLRVVLHKGQAKIDGMWAWQIAPNQYIGGLTEWGNVVSVGCNPVTMGEVNPGVVFHELGHFWLTTNYGITSHDAKYDPIFHWSGLGTKKFGFLYRKSFAIDNEPTIVIQSAKTTNTLVKTK